MMPERTPDHTAEMAVALAEHRRRLEALSAANRAAVDQAQAIASANLAAIHQAVADLEERLHHLEAAESAQVRAARQVALFKAGLERAAANLEQLRHLIHQAQASARMVLSQRVVDAMDEAEAVMAIARH
jgi:phasin family protein